MKFERLCIASGLKCPECDQFKRIYSFDRFLSSIGKIEANSEFESALLKDLEQHIRDKHPDRAKAFLDEAVVEVKQ